MAIDWRQAKQGNAMPPIYYPSTFSRNEAKRVTFDRSRAAENVDITLKKDGGVVLEGTVVDHAGQPVPEVFVVVHRRDMLFDFVTAYTDQQGRYQIQGLAEGEFQVHLDAVHRGFVRVRMPIDIDGATEKVQRDFTLTKGVVISGKFVDPDGNDWEVGRSHGHAYVIPPQSDGPQQCSQFSLTDFQNKYRPRDMAYGSAGCFELGEGAYNNSEVLFPTKNTFLIQGMMAGKTKFSFSPKKEGQKVVKILYDGKDIMDSGIVTQPGQEINDVIVVVGSTQEEAKP